MSNGFEISDFLGTGKLGIRIIDAVSDMVGWVVEPHQIKRIAKAESRAAIVKAEGTSEAISILSRAETRKKLQEARRQVNIEQIIAKSVQQPEPESISDSIPDSDWIQQFVNIAQDVSDEQMQLLWAKILAGEVTKPGTYSIKTIHLLQTMGKPDAELFTRFSATAFLIFGRAHPIVHDWDDLIHLDTNYDGIQHLEFLGLVKIQTAKYGYENNRDSLLQYHDFNAILQTSQPKRLNATRVMFTSSGRELLGIANPVKNTKYLDVILQRFEAEGWPAERISATNANWKL